MRTRHLHPVLTLTTLAVVSAALLTLNGCAPGAEAQETHAAPPAPPVSVATVLARHVVEQQEFTGRIEAVESAQIRARVRGTVEGVAYRSSLMKYAGVFHMGVHKATIAAADVKPGDKIDVGIEIDDKPLPTDTVPRDLQRAIEASKRASAAWAVLRPSHRREHVKHVTEAKKPETRARRIATTIAMLEA